MPNILMQTSNRSIVRRTLAFHFHGVHYFRNLYGFEL